MKNKLLTTTLLLLVSYCAFTQTSTAPTVRLENNPEHRTKVDLVFENNSDEFILLFTQFEDLTCGRKGTDFSGIIMQFFYEGKHIKIDFGGRLQPLPYLFARGNELIAPRSKIRLAFDIEDYINILPKYETGVYEVCFSMSYAYSLLEREDSFLRIVFTVTNLVTIEPAGDVENKE
jgi:hypothetical protein